MSNALTETSKPPAISLDDVQHFVLDNASWDIYEKLLREVGNRPIRLTYDQGRLELMSPLPEHEAISRIIGSLVVELALATNSPMLMLGSTTFRRRLKKKGLEPDECFYFANEGRVRGKKRLILPKDPPPDLAVEIDITSRSIERLPIYAALGVPEIWRYDGRRIRCLVLEDGEYRPADYSLTFGFLRPSDLKSYIERASRDGHTATILAFREWVKKSAGRAE